MGMFHLAGGQFSNDNIDKPNRVLHGYLLNFAAGKFSTTKVFDTYPLGERGLNFPKMAFFKTKSKTGTKVLMKHLGNVLSPKLVRFIHDSAILWPEKWTLESIDLSFVKISSITIQDLYR